MKKLLFVFLVLLVSSLSYAGDTTTIHGTTINLPDDWDNFMGITYYPVKNFYIEENRNIVITAYGTEPGWPYSAIYATFIDHSVSQFPRLVGVARLAIGPESEFEHYIIDHTGDLVLVSYEDFLKAITSI